MRAWYNSSGLADCQHHSQGWSDLAKHIENNQVSIFLPDVILTFCFLKLKFGPVIQTPPYSEGEFYTVLERNVSIQVRSG